jgi:hypothetical protein
LLCAACGGGGQYISGTDAGAHAPALVSFGDGFAAAWYDTRDGHADIYTRLLDPAGRPSGPEQRVTSDSADSYEPDIAAIDADTLAIAWYEKDASGALRPHVGTWGRDGRRQWSTAVASAGRNAAVRPRGRDLFVAWIQDDTATASSVWGQFYGGDGKPIDMPMRLAPASRTTGHLNAEVDRYGRAWVVFDARAGTRSDEVFLVRAGSTPTLLTADDGVSSKGPDISVSGGRVAVAWSDERDGNKETYFAVISDNDLTRFETRARRLTMTRGASIGVEAAWNGPLLGVAWSDETEGRGDVYLQIFGAGGRELGAIERITGSGRTSGRPAMAPWGDRFALAWSEGESAGDGRAPARGDIAFKVIE